ncbi:stage II sporulation protein D [Clostridium sp. CAG:470]|nr:MAG: stage II sporulation protein D [Clostridium sp. 28_17]CDE14974.1 stage II sporulation protein D [Clostridium sp. CAG:470]
MKKILIYLLSFILIIFIIPAFLTKRTTPTSSKKETERQLQDNNQQEQTTENQTEISNKNTYNYSKYGTISLLHKKTGEVEQVKLDEYLCNVVSAEMPATFEQEALKAQAIVARTYTIYKILNKKHDNADICDDSTCCQAWISKDDRLAKWEENQRESNWQKICSAVNETSGKIITYENKPIDAFFHSNSGGITEVPVNVWGGTGYPYLQSVETSGENTYTQYASEVTLSQEELINKLKEKYSDISIDFTNSDDIKILEYTESTRVKTVKFGNHEISGVEARTLFGLKSTNFEISRDGNNIKFSVKGYGHGVGMSQTGADSMAKNGSRAEEIIKHFYTGVEITEVNKL